MKKSSIDGLEFLRKDLMHPYSEYNGDLKKLFEVPHINLLQLYESNRDNIRTHGLLGFQRVTIIQDQSGLYDAIIVNEDCRPFSEEELIKMEMENIFIAKGYKHKSMVGNGFRKLNCFSGVNETFWNKAYSLAFEQNPEKIISEISLDDVLNYASPEKNSERWNVMMANLSSRFPNLSNLKAS